MYICFTYGMAMATRCISSKNIISTDPGLIFELAKKHINSSRENDVLHN